MFALALSSSSERTSWARTPRATLSPLACAIMFASGVPLTPRQRISFSIWSYTRSTFGFSGPATSVSLASSLTRVMSVMSAVRTPISSLSISSAAKYAFRSFTPLLLFSPTLSKYSMSGPLPHTVIRLCGSARLEESASSIDPTAFPSLAPSSAATLTSSPRRVDSLRVRGGFLWKASLRPSSAAYTARSHAHTASGHARSAFPVTSAA